MKHEDEVTVGQLRRMGSGDILYLVLGPDRAIPLSARAARTWTVFVNNHTETWFEANILGDAVVEACDGQ